MNFEIGIHRVVFLNKLALCWIGFTLVGCSNMTTPVGEIPIPRISTAAYDPLNCFELSKEFTRLVRIDREFSLKQEDRAIDSVGHAFYYGWGKGDGVETIELIKVKSEIRALKEVFVKKTCRTPLE